MQIVRTETPTGGPNRTPRHEITSLFTGPRGVEPEQYPDCSQSTGWSWRHSPSTTTWTVQLGSMKGFLVPFAQLDSQAGKEKGGGGIATYPFNHQYLPLSDKKDEDGEVIIDLNPDNCDERLAYFMKLYPQYFQDGIPAAGGTEIMSAIAAGDEHFMEEFGEKPRGERPIRARVVWTDGELTDAAEFQAYLAQATAGTTDADRGLGVHGEWDEAWAVAIFGEEDGGGHAAYQQYLGLAETHPWVHAYYFENVKNDAEVSEDMALAVVPTRA